MKFKSLSNALRIAVLSICFSPLVGAQGKIDIHMDSTGGGLIPLVIESQDIRGKEVASHLEKTGLFKSYSGSCTQVSSRIRQDLICLSGGGDNWVVDIPLSGKYKFRSSKPSSKDVADLVYKKSLSVSSSPFLTKLALVVKGGDNSTYKLLVTDYMGGEGKTILESPLPILSPQWSPDGRYLTYVSFETYRTSIFVQNMETGVRLNVFESRGLNAYPYFKDDRTLLLSLSGEQKGSNLFEYDLITRKKTAVTNSEKYADVYPVPTVAGISFVRMFNDIPYLYIKGLSGDITQLSKAPNNTPNSNSSGTKMVSSRGGYIYLWDMLIKKVTNVFETKDRIESLSISDSGRSFYYVTDSNNGYNLVSLNEMGHKMFELKPRDSDVIQVAAY